MSRGKMILKEKVASFGSSRMSFYSNAELIALITKTDPEALQDVDLGDGNNLLNQMMQNPRSLPGIGKAKALTLEAVKELVKRIMEEPPERGLGPITGAEAAARIIMPSYRFEQKEHFGVMCLNTKNYVTRIEDVFVGSLTASVVHPREVFKAATDNSAASIIVFHNHPSGDPEPSREDVAVTNRLVKAGKIMDIPVLDHIIIGNGRYYSFKDRGLI